MGSGPENAELVEIDWNDYFNDRDEWGELFIEHESCQLRGYYHWSLQEAIDWALEHHKICPLIS